MKLLLTMIFACFVVAGYAQATPVQCGGEFVMCLDLARKNVESGPVDASVQLQYDGPTLSMGVAIFKMEMASFLGDYTFRDSVGFRQIDVDMMKKSSVCSVGYRLVRGLGSRFGHAFLPGGHADKSINFNSPNRGDCLKQAVAIHQDITKRETIEPTLEIYFVTMKQGSNREFLMELINLYPKSAQEIADAVLKAAREKELSGISK